MRSRRGFALTKKVATIIVFASGITFLAAVLVIVQLRNDAVEAANADARDMATVLAGDVANSISNYDHALLRLVAYIKSSAKGDVLPPAELQTLRQSLNILGGPIFAVDVIAVTDAFGTVIAATNGPDEPRRDIGTREDFVALSAASASGLYMTKPWADSPTGAERIYFARRLENSDGRFLGIVFLGVEAPRLFRNHEALTASGEKTLSVFYADATVALREPNSPAHLGKPMPKAERWLAIARQGGGVYRSEGVFDKFAKHVIVRPVAGYPLFVNVGVADRFILAKWRGRAITIMLSSAAAMALVLALLWSQVKLRGRISRLRMRSGVIAKRIASQRDELARTRKRFGASLDHISQGMAIYDASNRLIISNDRYAELYGLTAHDMKPGMSILEVFDVRAAKGTRGAGNPEDYLSKLGSPNVEERLISLTDGRTLHARDIPADEGGWMTVQEDITSRCEVELKLLHNARHDILTGLPNRFAFKEHLAERLASSSGEFAVLLTDINGFKAVNDTYGHEIGDHVLTEVARRLSQASGNAFVARLGGDEFVATALFSAKPLDDARELAARFIDAVAEPVFVDGRRIALGLSVGLKIVQSGVGEIGAIMRHADLALYAAKKHRPNGIQLFDDQMDLELRKRRQLALDLREALAADALDVHYQPIVEAMSGRVACMEALARWRHPTLGMISPLVFIALAEEIGVINELGEWILRRACRDAATWRSDIIVAVNVSALQVERPDFVETVMDSLARARLWPHRLQLEITESVLLRKNEATREHLMSLREYGVTFALDDFGTGYASLAYLKVFPLDKIKIDKAFVDDICANHQSVAIVDAIVRLAAGIGVETTAEGVETFDQVVALRSIGVTTMQGYYFSRPKPIGDHDPLTIREISEAPEGLASVAA